MAMISNSHRPLVAIVGPFHFPRGGAAARRIWGNAQTLSEAGYDVLIGAGQKGDPARSRSITRHIRLVSLNERIAEDRPTLLKHLIYLGMGKATRSWLDRLGARPEAIILYSGYTPYLMRLLPWCREKGIPLVFDAVEWYQPSHLQGGGAIGPNRWNNELALRYLAVKANNIIAISRFLQHYYDSKRCRTIRIPPTLDTQKMTPRIDARPGNRTILGYAGSPGKKDLILPLLEAMARVDPAGARLELQIAGLDEAGFNSMVRQKSRSVIPRPGTVRCFGLLPYQKTWELIRSSDYSVVIRKPLRYAQAGFPTKVVESLALGTPVICNITSDLGSYIHDGAEGFVSEDWRKDNIAKCLDRALSLAGRQKGEMRRAARQCAIEHFDYRNYIEGLSQFIRSLPRPGGHDLQGDE